MHEAFTWGLRIGMFAIGVSFVVLVPCLLGYWGVKKLQKVIERDIEND
jgi:hypothetical protein